jgi:hypothetical protein
VFGKSSIALQIQTLFDAYYESDVLYLLGSSGDELVLWELTREGQLKSTAIVKGPVAAMFVLGSEPLAIRYSQATTGVEGVVTRDDPMKLVPSPIDVQTEDSYYGVKLAAGAGSVTAWSLKGSVQGERAFGKDRAPTCVASSSGALAIRTQDTALSAGLAITGKTPWLGVVFGDVSETCPVGPAPCFRAAPAPPCGPQRDLVTRPELVSVSARLRIDSLGDLRNDEVELGRLPSDIVQLKMAGNPEGTVFAGVIWPDTAFSGSRVMLIARPHS